MTREEAFAQREATIAAARAKDEERNVVLKNIVTELKQIKARITALEKRP